MNVRTIAFVAGTVFAACATAAGADVEERERPADDSGKIEEVVVRAHVLSDGGLAQASDALAGVELDAARAANIGETLSRLPGINIASFGNAVGRPVIHGLGGPRVRVMQDRIDTLDVSVTSADHAVTVEPFLAERIEILKGPSALLYGSGAIGGVVDVQTGRIPQALPARAIQGGIETRYDDNTEGNTTVAKLNGAAGSFAWHLDGTSRDGDEYEIPGFAESAALRALEEEEHEEGEEEEEHEEEEEVRGMLPGSDYDFESYAGGVSYIGDWGRFGVSVSQIDAEYGLPGGHGHEEEHEEGEEEEEEHEEEEGNPTLDLEQTRVDAELAINNPFGAFESLNIRFGINDYEHQEIEPNGEVATNFENDAWELRAELTYAGDNHNGAFGVQHTDREFSAVGEEAFVPPVDTVDTGLFWAGERYFDGYSLEAGLRLGQVEHDPQAGRSRDFDVYAISLGAVVELADTWSLGVIFDQSTRAPVAEELFSNGPHLATQAFEIGNAGLDEESSTSLSGTLRGFGENWSIAATAYYTDFGDFIYEQATGEIEDDLPVFVFLQDDASVYGLDVEGTVTFARGDWGTASLRGMVDFVEAEVDVSGNDHLPRIPPMRYGVGVFGNWGIVSASVDYLIVDEQDDIAPQELVTDEYDDLRASVRVTVPAGDTSIDLFLIGKNLTDDEQRHHASFIKDFAPAPGRTVEAGLRISF